MRQLDRRKIMVSCAFSSPGIAATLVSQSLSMGLGHELIGFDRVDGMDLLDPAEIRHAAAGCAVVVHLAALAHDTAGSAEQIMTVNVLGIWHVLLAAEAAGVSRVIHFSSTQVFGIAEGERLPDYFPVDDAHPRRVMRPYGLSKRLAEDLCAGFTARTGIASIAAPGVGLGPWPVSPDRVAAARPAHVGVGTVLGLRRVRGRTGRRRGSRKSAHGSTGRPSQGGAVRSRHLGHCAQPRPRRTARARRAHHRLGALPVGSLARAFRLLSS